MAVRVHLADDHTMFREGLESILSSRGGGVVKVVGRSSTGGEDAVALIETNKPDVVITQIDEDISTAQEILQKIRSASPESRIVVLTMFDNPHHLKGLSKLGIDAYVHKSSSSQDLIATINSISRDPEGGNAVLSIPRGLLERLEEEPVGTLTERDRGGGARRPRTQ
jgi:DNA-binding NarL/FixJ family response regulator